MLKNKTFPSLLFCYFIISPLYSQFKFSLTQSQSFYINTNLPNFENLNGLYLPKGYGSFTSIGLNINGKNFLLSAEPFLIQQNIFKIDIPSKESHFSVLNDVPKNNYYHQRFNNLGIKLFYNDLVLGFGNWNAWWGPGIHNSLILSNNAPGFYHYFMEIGDFENISNNFSYNFKFMSSTAIENLQGYDYFYSAWFLKLRHKYLELGISRNVLSGGIDIKWNAYDTLQVLINSKNILMWDLINEYYIKANFENIDLVIFFDIGIPKRNFAGKNQNVYYDHAVATNMGFRKKGAMGFKNIIFGAEYTNLILGRYFNIIPTPNWFDNKNYNFSSFRGYRWSSHSGPDSDDFLLFIGYEDQKKGIVYGLNFERHGVTYNFPPEVKFENRINLFYTFKKTVVRLLCEFEYFEHYGFVDDNKNIWSQTFEDGSIQRTNSAILSFERVLNF